jgi:hypothetical protein
MTGRPGRAARLVGRSPRSGPGARVAALEPVGRIDTRNGQGYTAAGSRTVGRRARMGDALGRGST